MAQLVKNPPANVGDLGSIPGVGIPLGEGKGYPLQYSGLEKSMDYSTWGRKELDKTATFTSPQSDILLTSHSFCLNDGLRK